MYISQHQQNSEEWLLERSTIVTASEAYKIMPPKYVCSKCGNEKPKFIRFEEEKAFLYCNQCNREFSLKYKGEFLESGITYAYSLVAAKYLTELTQQQTSFACEWGNENEPIARQAYEEKHDTFVEVVGLCKPYEDAFYGCSPDGLVGNDGIIEIKCPLNPENYIKYILGDWKKHLIQMQFCLFVLERQWCDFISFHPFFEIDKQLFIKRIFADKQLHEIFKERLIKFEQLVEKIKLEFEGEF